MNTVSDLFIADGTYTQLTKVNLRSNITIRAHPGKATIKLPGDYISLNHVWNESRLENILIDGLSWALTSNKTVNGSYGPITIDGPNTQNIIIRNCRSVHTSKTAKVNFAFIKVSAGKSANTITFENNSVTGARMGFEILNQNNNGQYTAKNIKANRNTLESCDYGISISGTFDLVETDQNYLKNCPTYGIEYAGALRNSRLTNNRFEGTFNGSLFVANWSSTDQYNDGDFGTGSGYFISGNQTVGLVNSRLELTGAGSTQFINNYLNISGEVIIGKDTKEGLFEGNTFILGKKDIAFKVAGPQNRFTCNTIKATSTSLWKLLWADGSMAKNNVFINNILDKISGDLTGEYNTIPHKLYNNYDRNGNPLNVGSGSARMAVSNTSGTKQFSGDGVKTQFVIPHGLDDIPVFFSAESGSVDASEIQYRMVDKTNIVVVYSTAPPAGTDNIKIIWSVK
ncbi:hypothetical protein GCM10027299_03160 [Larkinella ripae]